jgi:DNA-binding MarR family transcriptional regulator
MRVTLHPDRAALATCSRSAPTAVEALLVLVHQLAWALLGLIADCARDASLSRRDYLALLRIVTDDGIVPSHLRQVLGISAGSMTDLADRLQGRGLITRVPRATDRRSIELRPTATGHRIVERTMGPVVERATRVVDELTEDQRAVVVSFLGRVAGVLATAT